jgi:hypothetical protein
MILPPSTASMNFSFVGLLRQSVTYTTQLAVPQDMNTHAQFQLQTELSHQMPLSNKTAVCLGHRSDMQIADSGEIIRVCMSTFCSELF